MFKKGAEANTPVERTSSDKPPKPAKGFVPPVVKGRVTARAEREPATGGILHAPCMNSKILSVLGGDPTLRRLIFHKIDTGDFSLDNVTTGKLNMINLDMVWVFNQLRLPRAKLELRDPLTIAECLMSYIPDAWKLSKEDAEKEFCNTFVINWKEICSNQISIPGVTYVYEQFAGRAGDPWGATALTKETAPTEVPSESAIAPADGSVRRAMNDPHVLFFNPDILMCVLKIFVQKIENETMLLRGRGLAPSLSIGFCKRGSITVQFWNKITKDLGSSNPTLVPHLDRDRAKSYYNRFGSLVNDGNVGDMFRLWDSYIPGEAVRFRVTIDQAKGSGLTGIESIQRAFQAYPNFPWYKVRRLFPIEFATAIDAMILVGNNHYYGFRSDLGIVKYTNYPGVIYVAMQLLKQGLGDRSLSSYMGAKSPGKKLELDLMIHAFLDQRTTEVDLPSNPSTEEEEEVNRLQAASDAFIK